MDRPAPPLTDGAVGAVNVRDLGGRPAHDGARVRHGLVYRGDHLGGLTDADLLTLAGLGLDPRVLAALRRRLVG
ncbi:tyrosine-protein phosphatase [Streptomyces roseolus]|uniref:tyrosine-protein phosphatase n=1 Tax=Streptomyces roseolus TaxID=67358 RepID=UPI00365A03AD